MNKLNLIALLGAVLTLNLSAQEQSAQDIQSVMRKTFDWQLANPYSANMPMDSKRGLKGWIHGVFLTGAMEAYRATGDAAYLDYANAWAEKVEWQPGIRERHADDHIGGQTFIELYELENDDKRIAAIKNIFDKMMADPKPGTEEWYWCDALYMAPPTLARLAKVTGDTKYLDFMDKMYWETANFLFDSEEHLFFRDKRFMPGSIIKKEEQHKYKNIEPNGRKVFWSRGNGWVFGGLARTIPYIPEEYPSRAAYIELFKKLAERLVELQPEDGLWRPSLLCPEPFDGGEVSGSAFFAYGLLWGINEGFLDKETYLPPAMKCWNAMLDCVHDNGMLGYVQPVGAAPDAFNKDTWQEYGTGAFLAAGSELLKLMVCAGISEPVTFCRFVPEREDDFAWENDKIAFRAYGPALEKKGEDSGFDAWLKRVETPIIEKWYAGYLKGISYHKDHGEGYDPYKVGSSRGCGGLALWIDGKMVPSNVFKDSHVVQCETEESIFVLSYEWKYNGDTYAEEKQISIKLGDRLFKSTSTFKKNGKVATDMPIAIGLVRHHKTDLVAKDLSIGWMSIWEPMDDSELGTGVVIDPKRIVDFQLLETGKKLEDHALIITKTDAKGQLEYFAGYGWEKAGEIKTAESWNVYLKQYAKRITE